MPPTLTQQQKRWDEIRDLYLEMGAEEVWIVDEEGGIRFFGEEEMERSALAPECPSRV